MSVVLVAAVLAGTPEWAGAQAGWYLTPSFTLTEEFDDNVFGVSRNKRSDFITRLSPGITAGYQSEPLTLLGSYTLGAEFFADNSELNGVNHHEAGLEVRHLPTRLITLGLDASYAETRRTTRFFVRDIVTEIPTLEIGRRRASAVSVSPSVAVQWTPLTSTDASYTFAHTDASGGSEDTTHQAHLRLVRQMTPRDQGTVGYRLRLFESDRAESVTSHAVTLGWSRRLTEVTLLALEAGPRFSDGDVDAEASARLDHRFKLATLSLAYSRSEALAVGRAGAATTDRLSGSLSFEPRRALTVTLVARVLRRSEDDDDGLDSDEVTAYAAGATAAYQLTSWLTLRGAYTFSLQEGNDTIRHHVVSISLDFLYPTRLF